MTKFLDPWLCFCWVSLLFIIVKDAGFITAFFAICLILSQAMHEEAIRIRMRTRYLAKLMQKHHRIMRLHKTKKVLVKRIEHDNN